MIYIYDILLLLFFVPAVLLVALRFRKRFASEFLFRLGERFGYWDLAGFKNDKPLIWVHCASLGEAKAVEPVLKKLAGYSILITAVTLSGRQYALDMKLADRVFFVPFDFSFIVKKVLKQVRASALLLVETELWPGLITEAEKSGAKVIVVNARLSMHSYPSYRLFGFFWKPVLKSISVLCARSKEDAARFKALGVPPDNITVTGNIKYDNLSGNRQISKQELGFDPEDAVWVCGSTRKGENESIINAFNELKSFYPALKLVIAPRHTGRAGDIVEYVKRSGFSYALRSKGGTGATDCLVIDTFGELWKYYAAADIAFVGGSLVNKGGQNPIEPAAFAKPVLFGEHMGNFLSESRAIMDNGGGFMVRNGQELFVKMKELLADKDMRFAAGRKAFEAVAAQKGAVERTVALIKKCIKGRENE